MMTKSALKTLWFGGGGVLAWLAVTPNQGVPTAAPAAPQQTAATREQSAVDWKAQAERLRWRTEAVTLRASTRNPFRFNAPKSPPRTRNRAGSEPAPAAVASVEAPVSLPSLTLSGIAETKTQEGARRTAVISGDGQLYLVREGDSVAGRYTVIAVNPDAVLLRDSIGAELRLLLR